MSWTFSSPIIELKDFADMEQALLKKRGPVQICGCIDSQKVDLMQQLCDNKYAYKLIVTYNDIRAKEIYEDFKLFYKDVAIYPAKDFIFYSADVQGNLLVEKRISVLKQMIESKGGVFVTTIDGLMNHLPNFDDIEKNIFTLTVGEEVDVENLRKKLVRLGYESAVQVENKGQFAVRGGIIDIFSLTEEVPYRIDLWGDEIDGIRSFDVESQRSIEQLENINIYPATEMILDDEKIETGIEKLLKDMETSYEIFRKSMKTEEAFRLKSHVEELIEELRENRMTVGLEQSISYFYDRTVSFLDYFDRDETLVFLDEPLRLQEKGQTVEAEFRESMTHRLENGYLLGGQTEVIYSVKEMFSKLQREELVLMTGLDLKLPMFHVENKYSINVQNAQSYKDNFDLLIKDLTRWKKEDYRVILLCGSRVRAQRLAKDLREYDLRAFFTESLSRVPISGEIVVTYGNLHRGFVYPMIKFIMISENDIFGKRKDKKKKKTPYDGKKISSYTELAIGDYVIHENHGIGIYKGIEKVTVDHVVKDYIRIEYGDGGSIYVPATQLDLIQKYSSKDGRKVKLTKLGSNEWGKTKKRVKKAVSEVAKELVELYAVRRDGGGFQYSPDTVWQTEFEELFEYEETSDQLEAIESTKKDMESRKIMDRLICGDVGYGKTEIAIRAAFKAVQDNKQVVYLVPTTILAQQHYNTFSQRMKDFPVRIDLLSRFRTPRQQQTTIADLKRGLVDIVIGTHRVLSKDIEYKDLGLLIIDEEQRFGVTHKEKIKQLKKSVDVLTLTATPIPRTLHMSLIGVRDISVLEEAPSERVPIQTYVMEYNSELVREAINRELARNGQVYYVYNRVRDIDEMASQISNLVPDANVAYAHGQMHEHELERIMLEFINGEIDVLVSTTIIETGLDISNVNTMIIHDADRFGLSTLYQLRGRIGRSNRIAYAFILYKPNKMLKEEAQKRLEAIREFTELGSGIKIAMRDLEIRGAGTLLGEQQHGHMEAVGYDLYCKMLNEAVKSLKGEIAPDDTFETSIDINIDAYIPATYIKNESLKLDMYKKIASIETDEEYMDMQDELMDRFGELPKPVQNLLLVASVKSLAHSVYITDIVGNRQEVRLKVYKNAKYDTQKLQKLLEKYRNKLKFTAGKMPVFLYAPEKNNSKATIENLMDDIKNLLGDMKML